MTAHFVAPCESRAPHAPHEHTVLWKKAALPLLRDPHLYPEEWTADYRCRGVDVAALVERARQLADRPVQSDDGFRYTVPARDLVETSETLRHLAAALERVTGDAMLERIAAAMHGSWSAELEHHESPAAILAEIRATATEAPA